MLTKVTKNEREGKGVTGLPDTPGLTTTALQERFDSLGNLAIDALNRVVDELSGMKEGETGADNITATVPDGIVARENLQSILTAIAALVVQNGGSAHTHTNKGVLDGITAELKMQYDKDAELFKNITTVESGVTNNRNALPTSAAVMTLLASYDYQNLKDMIYPVGSVFFSYVNMSPDTFIGGTWSRVQLIDGVYSWRREL